MHVVNFHYLVWRMQVLINHMVSETIRTSAPHAYITWQILNKSNLCKKGLGLNMEIDNLVFILVLYLKLPVFCYRCGRIGHGQSKCTFVSSRKSVPVPQPPVSFEKAMEVDEQVQHTGEADKMLGDDCDISPIGIDNTSSDFGSWMKPRSRRSNGRGRSRGGAGNSGPS